MGSEMCIRDSNRAAKSGANAAPYPTSPVNTATSTAVVTHRRRTATVHSPTSTEEASTERGAPGTIPSMIDQVAEVLRDTPRLVQRQKEDARLGPIGGRLRRGGGRHTPEWTANYVFHDNDLLWSTPQGEAPKLAIPRALVPGLLALVHSTYGHSSVARTSPAG